jgi:hypothetical protein
MGQCVAATEMIGQFRGHANRRTGNRLPAAPPGAVGASRISSREFGPIVSRRGKADLVDLKSVERQVGLHFTREQLLAAGLYVPVTKERVV